MTQRYSLTARQKECLLAIEKHFRIHGVAPSFDELAVALKLKSKSGIYRLINGLKERGFIDHLPNRARSITLKDCNYPGVPIHTAKDLIARLPLMENDLRRCGLHKTAMLVRKAVQQSGYELAEQLARKHAA